MRPKLICAAIAAIAAGVAAFPQDRDEPSADGKRRFEVASVKPSAQQGGGAGALKSKERSGTARGSCGYGGGGVEAWDAAQRAPTRRLCLERTTLLALIYDAYGLPACPNATCGRVTGGPDWIKSDWFDIDARAPEDTATFTMARYRETPHVQQMLQSLLAERFGLQIQRESREASVFALTVARGGHRLTPNEDPESPRSIGLGGKLDGDTWDLGGRNLTMPIFAAFLSDAGVAGLPVIDRTGLEGAFNLSVQFANENSLAPSAAPPLSKALEEKLGLRLEAARAPIETLVIDRVEQPSEN